MTNSERALWHEAIRNTQPLQGRAAPVPARPSIAANPVPLSPQPSSVPRAGPRPILVRDTGRRPIPGLDRATGERLRRGQIPLDARIDLHGMTRDVAHRALNQFVRDAWRRNARLLLVITGKGSRPSSVGGEPAWIVAPGGVLRREVPHWLPAGEHQQHILAVAEAHAAHGGAGALYVLLRRQRS